MEEKRAKWRSEAGEIEAKIKEGAELRRKTQQREQEEYNYNLQRERQKDKDDYELKKFTLEKSLQDKREQLERNFAEREAAIKVREAEFSELSKQVETFPAQLEKAIIDTKEQSVKGLDIKHQYETNLRIKEIEGERKLSQQTIMSLQAKLKEQEALIEKLSQRANQSNHQVQEIALKAIESSSNVRHVGSAIANNVIHDDNSVG